MKIEMNIEKKYFYILLSVIIIFAGFLIVNAYGTSAPTTFGHSAGEIVEADPTVLASVKDGVNWSEVTSKPAGFADGVDDVGSVTCPDCGACWVTALYSWAGSCSCEQCCTWGYYRMCTPTGWQRLNQDYCVYMTPGSCK